MGLLVFLLLESIAVLVGALVAFASLFPLLRLRKLYSPKRIVLQAWSRLSRWG